MPARLRVPARVAVLLGVALLLLMPHTGGQHPPAAAGAAHVAAGPGTGDGPVAGMAGQVMGDLAVSVAPAAAGDDGPSPSLLALGLGCAVVLLAVAAVRRRSGLLLAEPRPPAARPPAALRSSQAGRGPPRALLAEICVLRT